MSSKLVSTILGVVLAIIAIISAIGLITQEQAASLQEWIPVIVNAIFSILAAFGIGELKAKNLF